MKHIFQCRRGKETRSSEHFTHIKYGRSVDDSVLNFGDN